MGLGLCPSLTKNLGGCVALCENLETKNIWLVAHLATKKIIIFPSKANQGMLFS
jgi:hypothetical protein